MRVPAPAERSLALALASPLLLLTGPALAIAWGVAPAVIVLAAAVALAAWRGRTLAGAGGWSVVLSGMPRTSRVIAGAMFVLPLVIVTAVAARAIAGLCVAFPAITIGIAVLVVLAPAVGRVRGRGAPVAGLAAAALAIAATSWAVRFEAEAPGARGFAHSGPILGIHPFQSTAIVIDGYGPFDLPINDYVEPDGSKGYGPAELAEALERALHTIAEVHFADGPRRAREAFAGATVEAVTLPAIQERLDRPVAEGATEPRLLVHSGTTGRRSRVEFVCPGSPADPRPRGADAVMERMCPDKYSSEASAGLGLTGRWTGYTEGRGQARVSLAPLTEDLPLPALWEERGWAWIVLIALVLATRWQVWATGLARATGGLWAAGLAVLAVMAVRTWPMVQVGLFEAGPTWMTPWALAPWVAALPVMLVVALGAGAGWAVAGGVLAVSLWTAGVLAATVVLRPGSAGFEGWAAAVGERVAVDLTTAESAAALVIAAGLLRLLALAVGPAARRVAGAIAPQAPRPAWLGVVIAGLAGLVVLSRKTAAGALLLAPALALTLAAITGLAVTVAGPRRGLRVVDHAVAVGLVVVAAREAWAARSNEFMLVGLILGLLLAAASLVLLRVRTADPASRA